MIVDLAVRRPHRRIRAATAHRAFGRHVRGALPPRDAGTDWLPIAFFRTRPPWPRNLRVTLEAPWPLCLFVASRRLSVLHRARQSQAGAPCPGSSRRCRWARSPLRSAGRPSRWMGAPPRGRAGWPPRSRKRGRPRDRSPSRPATPARHRDPGHLARGSHTVCLPPRARLDQEFVPRLARIRRRPIVSSTRARAAPSGARRPPSWELGPPGRAAPGTARPTTRPSTSPSSADHVRPEGVIYAPAWSQHDAIVEAPGSDPTTPVWLPRYAGVGLIGC
jgi:hypothetical protein